MASTKMAKIIGTTAVATAAAVIAYPRVLRPWFLRWGATENEVQRVIPGDEFVPTPRMSYTRAITIDAPVDRVWPWIAQMGEGRGGLYSYQWLEELMGSHTPNAECILPNFQKREVGDDVLLYPNGPWYRV